MPEFLMTAETANDFGALSMIVIGLVVGALISWYLVYRNTKNTIADQKTQIDNLSREKSAAEKVVKSQKEVLILKSQAFDELTQKHNLKEIELKTAQNKVTAVKGEADHKYCGEIERIGLALEAAHSKIERMEDLYLATKVIDLKGVGPAVAEIFRKNDITMRKINCLSNNELTELLDDAMVPMAARKYDLKAQARKFIKAMYKAIGD